MLQLERARRWDGDAEAKERGYHARECRGDGVAVAGAVAAGGGGLAVVWCSCRHARPATPSLIEVRAATWGEDRSARVMMVTAAEEGEDGVQWQL